jgi:hypothetical protein
MMARAAENCGMFVVKSMANRARVYENRTSLAVRLPGTVTSFVACTHSSASGYG